MGKIKIDNKLYSIMDLSIEEIEGEYLAYNSEMETIIVFNKTASIIWNCIIEAIKKSGIITTNEICNKIMNEYNISESEFNTISTDVNELFSSFADKKILNICDNID